MPDPFPLINKVSCEVFVCYRCVFTHVEDEQDEEEQQDDLDADDEQLREEVSQHRLQGAHTWWRERKATRHPSVYSPRSKQLIITQSSRL